MKKYILFIVCIAALAFVQSTTITSRSLTKQSLGELLFFDKILSKDYTISCASCHRPEYAFADTSTASKGVGGNKGTRNTPSAMNLTLATTFFWDGRAKTLEEQALAPIENPVEMNLTIDEAIHRLKTNDRYKQYFKEVFNSEPSKENLAAAIASYERTLETSDSPFDNWKYSDNPTAVSEAVKRGFKIFNEKGNCIKCHFGADFTANEFRNIGLFNSKTLNDSGRSLISKNHEDVGKFKTPSLRNIAVTAPYMHNGMFQTLEKVIKFYNDTEKIIPDPINKDSLLAKPLGLTKQEMDDLKAFLISLTDKQYKGVRK